MICAILAAGYATRLYPLTENFPKPLIKVGERSILDWLISDVDASCGISQFVIISNNRYYKHFENWAGSAQYSAPLKLLNDGSTCNENRLGAVRDIQFAIEQAGIDDDLMVLAGDNVLDFSLRSFAGYFRARGDSCIMRYHEPDMLRISRSAAVDIDAEDMVLRMEEKPAEPFSNWCVPPFYIYARRDLPLVKMAIEAGCRLDSPGSLAAYMAGATRLRAMEMPGKRYDIGNMESYRMVCETYKGIAR